MANTTTAQALIRLKRGRMWPPTTRSTRRSPTLRATRWAGTAHTYKFATQFPDLFARAQPTVGEPAVGNWVPPAEPTGGEQSNTHRMLASLRNVPFLIWDET